MLKMNKQNPNSKVGLSRMRTFLFWALVLMILLSGYAKHVDFPVLKGPYLGQKEPGTTPVLFAPKVFKTEVHGGLVFSPDGQEVYWDLMEEGRNILFMRLENGQWTEPSEVPFRSRFGTGDATFSPDGKRLFFTSQESIEGGKKDTDENIWFVERRNKGWGEPKPLSSAVNSYSLHWQLSVAANGNLYFGADGDIYIAIPANGKYSTVEKVSSSINTEHYESTPYISPDESFMIFSRFGGDLKYADLFISFKDRNGTWTEAKNMGRQINRDMHELCPNVTADGRYLFFNRNYGEKGELRVFWVDAKIIEELKPKFLE
jgi:Tol biopolymer transport system component